MGDLRPERGMIIAAQSLVVSWRPLEVNVTRPIRLPTSADIQFVRQIHPPSSQCVRRLWDEDTSRPRVPVVSRQHSSDVSCPTTRVWSQISRA